MSLTTYGMMAWAGTGTGAITGMTAITGVTGFPAIADGSWVRFVIFDAAGNLEESVGISSSSGTAFTRVTVLRSSNTGSLVNFPGAATIQLIDLESAGGAGTVTSVDLALPTALFANDGAAITTSGNLTDSLATQTKNTVFAGPVSGSAAAPTFRALQGIDLGVVTADLTAQTAGVASVLAVTSPNDGSPHQYKIGVYANITAVTADVLVIQCLYTDENNAAQTVSFFPMGLTSANLSSVGAFAFPDTTIRVKANTAITVKANLTTGIGSISYDVGASIQQLN